jgi:excisionase family DNA binding protein
VNRLAYSVAEVAEMLGMSEQRVRALIKRGAIRAVQLLPGSPYLVPAESLDAALGLASPRLKAKPSKSVAAADGRAAMARMGLSKRPA